MSDTSLSNSLSLAAGREFLAIPGPTNVPDAVLAAMHRPAIDIYAGPMVEITDSLLADLKRVFRTEGKCYIYAANGHGAWEAALTNVLSRGDKVLVLESGRFALGWGEAAKMLGAQVEILSGDFRRAVDPQKVEERLKQDTKGEIKALLMVQIDTASGVINDVAAVAQAIRNAKHPALLCVDTVASLGCVPFEMDAWGVDVAMSGSQKGLMTPPGLGFTAVGAKARDAHKSANMRTPYWDWTFRDGPVHYQKYCGTPPEQLLFGLRAAFDLMFSEGQTFDFNVIDPAQRCDTVTTVITRQGDSAQPLVDYCHYKCGVVLGRALGKTEGRGFRIAHMGHVNAPMLLGALGAIEMGMMALKIPHGRGGVAAAIDYLAGQVPA